MPRNLSGNIYWRSKAVAELRVYVGKDQITGKAIYKRKTFRGDKRGAAIALAEFVAELKGAGRRRHATGTVGHLIEKYMTHLRSESLGRSPNTICGYLSIVRRVTAELGDVRLMDLTAERLDEYNAGHGERGCKPGTAMNHFRFIHAALRKAVAWRMLPYNPADECTKIQVPRVPVTPPDRTTVRSFITEALHSRNPDLAVAERLLAATGGRCGEACAARWSDFVDGTLTIARSIAQLPGAKLPNGKSSGAVLIEKDSKRHQVRAVDLDEGTVMMLEVYRAECEKRAEFAGTMLRPDAFILADQVRAADGSIPWRPRRISQAHRRIRERVGSNARLHDLRHVQASILADKGEGIPAIAARLGQHPETTMRRYGHLVGNAQQRAAKIVGDFLDGPGDED